MLLFLADYPDKNTLHEGMSQRIIAIDKQCKMRQRTYLFVSYRLFLRKQIMRCSDDAIQYRCNLFVHFFFILGLFRKASTIYFHSVINVLPILPLLSFIKPSQCIILDVHGVVPEEHQLAGIRWKSKLYQLSERLVLKKVDSVITVTEAMEKHFRAKYPTVNPRYIQYTILPAHIERGSHVEMIIDDEKQIRVVYSGNTQPWQNIELMIEVIKHNLSEWIRYDILTGQPELMKQYLEDAGLATESSVHVNTVSPDELKYYYQKAHYGFVLRDDITVNRVACPTKLIEYLYYGITPIVKSHLIGDFSQMGYEYIHHEDFSAEQVVRKSAVNHQLVNQLLSDNCKVNFQTLTNCYG